MSGAHRLSKPLVVLLIGMLLTACAGTSENNDPMEGANRAFHRFNNELDDLILRPVAEKYVEVTPESLRANVSNFFENVGTPGVMINDFLQGKFREGMQDAGRFLVNTTLGIGGLWDVAADLGVPRHEEDLGQTLGVWGAGEGAYLEIPFFGPNSVRDAPDIPFSAVTSILFYIGEAAVTIPLGLLGVVDTRAQLLSATRLRDESALDSYIFTREAYRQRRIHLIYDGDPPLEEFETLEQ